MLKIELDCGQYAGELKPLREALSLALAKAAAYAGAPDKARADIAIVNEEQIHQLNLEYRKVDRPTDVLSFPMIEYPPGKVASQIDWQEHSLDADPGTGEMMLGDIVISWPAVVRQAEEYGHGVARELTYLAVHGLTHLLGYDHEEEADKKRMRACEEEALRAAGLERESHGTEEMD